MRRAKLEGRRIGREPLKVDRAALMRERNRGLSLNQLAAAFNISKASVCRVLKEQREAVPRGVEHVGTSAPANRNEIQELAF